MKVAILSFEGVVQSSVFGPYDILSRTNGMIKQFDPENRFRFEVEILSTDENQPAGFVQGMKRWEDRSKCYDLIIIPAMDFEYIGKVMAKENDLVKWIKGQYEKGAEVASICMGAFLLAQTGLLNGKMATTHWLGRDLFLQLFPQITLVDDKIITDQERIYTSGGAFSFTSQIIYLIEKFVSKDIATIATRVFMIHLHDSVQRVYSIFTLQKDHADDSIKKIQEKIESNFHQSLSVERLAMEANMSVRNFIRRFKKAVGNSPLEYIQRVRIEAAKKYLIEQHESVERVCLSVGYDDLSAFRKIFKRLTGTTPSAYRKKYNLLSQPDYVGVYAS